jgi:hypothetical protein
MLLAVYKYKGSIRLIMIGCDATNRDAMRMRDREDYERDKTNTCTTQC